jgi:hypothetical protein
MDRRCFLSGLLAAGGLSSNLGLRATANDRQSLPTRPLGKTGIHVTVLALGG